MKLQKLGKNISEVEILNISALGIWIYIKGKEYFLNIEDFPWFYNAKIAQILNVELHHDNHIHWPDLDIDLDIDTLESPEKYPLVYK